MLKIHFILSVVHRQPNEKKRRKEEVMNTEQYAPHQSFFFLCCLAYLSVMYAVIYTSILYLIRKYVPYYIRI